ncbi:hypothetical protein BpHYR1_003732 [Brachionus plicatilis]|uniref:Uncharacterized protein n=1 Tax=Brachionus plicatilis TaxID=10195 RepID=A0A3M7QTZ4_BRAPC|nr:hypothetical protein BpHYR1_003732 [Brachionus plicatilis]
MREENVLTQDAINNEINNYWKSNNLKRKRITKNDIKFATNRLKKNRIEETNNMHLAILERNRDQLFFGYNLLWE